MKKTNKIIALILAMVLAFSSVPLMASAAAIDDKVDTVEKLIQGESLGDLVEWLFKNINNRKKEITPTILRLVFLFIEDDSLVLDYLRGDVDGDNKITAGDARLALRKSVDLEQFTEDQIKIADIDGKGVSASDARSILRASVGLEDLMGALLARSQVITTEAEKLATMLVNWLNANLPVWTAEITDQDWWGIVELASPLILGLGQRVDLDDVDGILNTLYRVCNAASAKGVLGGYRLDLGTLNKLNGSALKDVKTGEGKNLNVIYALLQWLADNTEVIKTALKGELSLGGLIEGVASGTSDDINAMVTDMISPAAIKEMLCDMIELNYDTYKDYTADEIVAVAFLKLLTGAETVSQEDAGKVMNLTIYEFLEEYAGKIYKNLLVAPLNNDVKALLVEHVKPLDDEYNNIFDKVFNWNYKFEEDTFDEFLGKGKGNLVEQLNNAVIKLLEVILTEDAFKALNLKEGGNENLEENLAKAFRFILPEIAKIDKEKLGADLSGFTADKVKNMSTEQMAVGVLKLFFPGWFKNAVAADVNAAKTLEQLAVLAAKYAVENNEWVPMEIKAAAKAVKVNTLSDEACLDLLFEIGMETAAKALDYNSGTTYYELPADTSKWTGEDYLDDIVDWALNFVDGLPASADNLSTERGVLDGKGGFYKINAVLDSLFDLSFISGCGNDTFKLDVETMLMDKFLGNLLDFDLDEAVAILAENEESEIFNKKINVAAIDLIDDLLTGLFVK